LIKGQFLLEINPNGAWIRVGTFNTFWNDKFSSKIS